MDKKATEKNNLNYQVRCLDPCLQTLLCWSLHSILDLRLLLLWLWSAPP